MSASDEIFDHSGRAQQGGIAERKAMIDRSHGLPIIT